MDDLEQLKNLERMLNNTTRDADDLSASLDSFSSMEAALQQLTDYEDSLGRDDVLKEDAGAAPAASEADEKNDPLLSGALMRQLEALTGMADEEGGSFLGNAGGMPDLSGMGMPDFGMTDAEHPAECQSFEEKYAKSHENMMKRLQTIMGEDGDAEAAEPAEGEEQCETFEQMYARSSENMMKRLQAMMGGSDAGDPAEDKAKGEELEKLYAKSSEDMMKRLQTMMNFDADSEEGRKEVEDGKEGSEPSVDDLFYGTGDLMEGLQSMADFSFPQPPKPEAPKKD